MRLCIIADASGPVDPNYPGHGLGQAAHVIASGLLKRGHDVTLVAAEGSVFDGELITPTEAGKDYSAEKFLAKAAYQAHKAAPFHAFLDNSHLHHLSDLFPDLPVVNVYHDIWQPQRRNAVLMSEGQRAMMPYAWSRKARVIHNTVNAEGYPFRETPDTPPYILFMGILRDYKNPALAMEACAIAGLPLKIAGAAPHGIHFFGGAGNTEYVGMVAGQTKIKLLQGASAFLQLGTHESFGLTTVEAGLCGVPVVALPNGGTVDLIQQGINGAYVPMSGNRSAAVADTIEYAMTLSRRACRDAAYQFTNVDRQVTLYEDVLAKAAGGEVW